MIGHGKYDDLCAHVREQANAEGALIAVFNGKHGSGFSMQAPKYIAEQTANILRQMADEIEYGSNHRN